MARSKPHWSFIRGKMLRLVLRTGEVTEGRFKESTDKYLWLTDGRKFRADELRSANYLHR